MKKIVFLIVTISLFVYAQEGWVRWYGNKERDFGYSICKAHNDGWLITGSTYNYEDLWIVRLDTLGDTLWTRQYGKAGRDLGMCIHPTDDGNYIISGDNCSCYSWYEAIWLLKVNPSGDTIWTRGLSISDDFEIKEGGGKWMEITRDGGFIITGYGEEWYNDSIRYVHRAFLVKTDSLGNIEWTHIFSEYGSSEGLCVQETNDGGYVITGFENADHNNGYGYLCLIKTDDQGNPLWIHHYYDLSKDYLLGCGYCVRQIEDGGFIIASDLGLIKTDSEGVIQYAHWVKKGECYYDIQRVNDGGYIVSGVQRSDDLILRKFSKDLLEEWIHTYKDIGNGGWYKTLPVLETYDGGFVTVGSKNDIFVIKTDSLGHTPVGVSPIEVESPVEGYVLHTVTPKARFTNFGTPDSALDLFYHCTVINLNDSTCLYHDSISGSLESWQSKWIEFKEWTAPTISDYKCIFYTTGAGRTQPISVNFRWTGIEEPSFSETPPVAHLEIPSPIGSEIVLRYSNCAGGFRASVFDASGREVDRIESSTASGTIHWGRGCGPGVYFIVFEGDSKQASKVVLIR